MPDHTKQTLKQAKASYKKHGPRISDKEQRQLQRGMELDRRAEEYKERERRRKEAMKKRKEREEKEKEIRSRMGVGLATQLAGFNHTQKQLKGAMESFLGLGKKQSVGNDSAAAEAAIADARKHDSLIDADDDFWISSPLDTSVHSQESGDGGGEACAGPKSPVPAPPSPGNVPGNLVHHQPTRPGEASTTKQNVKYAEQQGAQSPSTSHGHQDLTREDAPGAKSSQSDMWDDLLDDATMLSALKGKTPTSQAARQFSQVPTPKLLEPASPCERMRYQSEPVDLPSKRLEHFEEKFPSFTQPVDEDPLAAVSFGSFDDLFPSNSQIERELTPPKPTKSDKPTFPRDDLAAEGQREIELSSRAAQPALVPASRSRPQQQSGQAHGAPPSHVKSKSGPRSFDTIKQPHGTSSSSGGPSKSSPPLSVITNISRSRPLPLTTSKNANIPKTTINHDARAPRCPPGVPNISGTLPKPTNNPEFKRPAFAPPCQKRKTSQSASSLHPPVKKKLSMQSPSESRLPPYNPPRGLNAATATKPWVRPAPKSMSSSTTTTPSRFIDFGLSTQILGDAIDDDLDLSP
ncbi:hypothetical protein IWZ01DRAFT_180024 [Phyllosticta capitalensis]